MSSEKRDIILSEGVPVEVSDLSGTVVNTIALLGRSNRQFSTMVSLEAHRRGHFIPDISVDSGDSVLNTVTGDRYVVAASYREIYQQLEISIVTHLVLCNTKLTVTIFSEVVNARGDIKKTEVVKYDNVDVFTQSVTQSLRQENPGLYVDSEYVIHAPAIDVKTLDKVTLTAGTRKTPLKVVDTDYITFPGMVIIQACSETRK